jgi:hypothetical protein
MNVHPVVYHLVKTLTRLLLVLTFVGVPTAVWYLRVHGIGFGAREALGAALGSPAVEVTLGKLAVDPFEGLIASDIAITERGGGGRKIASLNRLRISLNLTQLLQRRIVVDRISLHKASARIPLFEGDEATVLDVQEINAEAILLGDMMRVSRFDGSIAGIRIRATGDVLHPLALKVPEDDRQPSAGHAGMLADALRVLRDISYADAPPLITLEFDYDAADPASLSMERFSLESGPLTHDALSLASVEIRGSYRDGKLGIPVLGIADNQGGVLQASADWDSSSGAAGLSILSSLNPAPFLEIAAEESPALADIAFPESPRIGIDLVADLSTSKPDWRAAGTILAPSISWKGALFRDLGAGFAIKDGLFFARNLEFSASRGRFAGDLWIAPSDYRLKVDNTIPPTEFIPVLDPAAAEFLARMEFEDLPAIELSLRAESLDFASIRGEGKLTLGRTAMRGAWIDSGSADLVLKDRCFSYNNLEILHAGGRGTGRFDYDIARQEVRLEEIRSTLDPVGVLLWIDPKIAEAVKPYRFRENPSVGVEGKVHMSDPMQNNLAISVKAPGGMDYDLLGKTLRFGTTNAEVQVLRSMVHADVGRADLMGGRTAVRADVSIDPSKPVFEVAVGLDRVDFRQLTKLYFDYSGSGGVLSGDYEFKARMGLENLMKGSGSVRIEEGDVFGIPLFGPFSTILGGILPGIAYNTARLATADFTVADEKITTSNMEIKGAGFSMYGNGDIYFLTGGLDLDMRINIQGIPGIIFYPVSKLFEYRSEGTLDDPRWRPKLVPRLTPPRTRPGSRGGGR